MLNCLIIHGCPSGKDDLVDISEKVNFKHWIPWVREKLLEKGIPTQTPLMPEPWIPNYEKFKNEFEKYEVNENTVLIGHSCGAAFLVRWLGDTKKKIKKLILVAPWKIAVTGEPEITHIREKYYNFPIDRTISSRVEQIIIFTADNEFPVGKESVGIYQKDLGGEVISLPGHGHYIIEHMGTAEFPELLEKII